MEFLNNVTGNQPLTYHMMLIDVTGVKGLMARSVLHQSAAPNYGTWHNSSVYPGWIWKGTPVTLVFYIDMYEGDTSSDEVVGHMFAYPIVYGLVAESAAEKQRVYRLISDIMSYIVDNGYLLIDVTGRHTTWYPSGWW